MTNLKTAGSRILDFMPDLIRLRRKLHANPELSDNESKTARVVREFFRQLGPDELIASLGSNGTAFLFDSGRPGPTVVFRCELDAIPVEEQNDFAYRFGLGAGETCPGLHQADYDFPEELIGIGSRIFMEIAKILVY